MSEQKERLGLILFLDSFALILSTFAVYMITNQMNHQPLIGDLALVLIYYVGIKILILAIADVTGIGRSVLVAIFFAMLANGVVIVVELFMSMGVARQLMLVIAVVDIVLIALVHTVVKMTAPGYKESKERRKWLADQDQMQDRDHDRLLDNLVSEKTLEDETVDPETAYEESKVDLEPLVLTKEDPVAATGPVIMDTQSQEERAEDTSLEDEEPVATQEVFVPEAVAAEADASEDVESSETEKSTEYFDHELYDDLGVTDEILTDLVTEQLEKQDSEEAIPEESITVSEDLEAGDTPHHEATMEEAETIIEPDQVSTSETAHITPVDISEEEPESSADEVVEKTVSEEKEAIGEIEYSAEDTKPVDSIALMTKSHHLETNLDYMRRSSKQTEAEELLNAVHSFSKELDSLEVSYSDEELSKTGNNIREKLKMIVDKQYVLDEVMDDLTHLSQQINMRIDDLDRIENELKRRADVLQKRENALDEIEKPVAEEIPFVLEPDEILVELDGATVIINKDDYALLMKNMEGEENKA
ncbi:MAG: hypothetical protein GX127_06185 [Eubacteriaceae bacterium]|nr:hypothetical protein [Eubacteriaceae bacterium]